MARNTRRSRTTRLSSLWRETEKQKNGHTQRGGGRGVASNGKKYEKKQSHETVIAMTSRGETEERVQTELG